MSELQATLEFSVELNKFYNVDLFQRGYYQIRTALRTPPKVPSKIEITLQKSQAIPVRNSNTPGKGQDNDIPAHVINDMAVSRTFQILYRSEDLVVNDVILYRFHTLVNSLQMEEEMSKLEIQLLLELWFSDEQNGTNGALSRAECVSTRTINIHFSPTKGLHHHVPILFDYFHLCCVEVTVHGTLIAIHQPFLSVPKQPKSAWSSRNPDQSTLETVYFGERPISADPEQCLPIHLHAAWQMHHRICNMLLSAYESLQTTFELYLGDICGSQFKLEHIDCHQKLEKLMDNIRVHDNEEEMIQNATRDITQLCAANVILWTQFLETATLDQGIIFHLAKEHHNARIKRMAEGFFTHEYQKNQCLACYEPSFHGHSDLAAMVRSSMYLQALPSLDLECAELDGDNNTLPIIFEDIYFDQAATNETSDRRRSSSLSPSFSQNSSPQIRSKPKRNFIKNIRPDTFKRPSSFNLQDAEAAANARAPKNVELVGYRKTIAAMPDVQRSRVVELGTFSPVSSGSSSPQVPHSMPNSVSLPSLDRDVWSRSSDSTLPEYMMVARRSLRAKKKNKKSSVITVDFGGSDPDIKSDKDSVKETHRLKRAYTDPARRVSSSSEKSNPDTSLSQTETQSSSSQNESKSMSRDVSMATESDDTSNVDMPDSAGNTAKKQLDFQQELYKNLSECLTKALGDDGLHDSDKSDDDTCIQNGYDDFLDTGNESQSYRNSEDYSEDQHRVEPPSQESDIPSENNCSTPQTSDDNIRDILKSNVLQLNAPGSKKPDLANGNASKDLEDVLSISEVNLTRDNKSSASGDDLTSQADSAITLTGSLSTLNSKDDSVIPDPVHVPRRTGDEVTVIELLKEEYKRSSLLLGSDINKSISDFSDSGVSGVSVKNTYKSSSDSNILHAVDSESTDSCVEMSKKTGEVMVTSASFPDITKLSEEPTKDHPKLVDKVRNSTISFINLRENLKSRMKFQGNLYSESSSLASQIPFFHVPDTTDDENQDGCHLIVCVHGLDGNSADLRLVKTYMEMALPGYRLEFLMSERNQSDTFADFDTMTKRLVNEVFHHIEIYSLKCAKISFVGHSLGTIIIRSALTHVEMIPLLPKLHTFLSLSGPHLGTLYNNSGLVNMGMWFMQKWKKSGSLLQLSLKDSQDPRQSFLYRLSQKPGLEFFRHVLLVGSSQDRYVPYHSSRIEMCKAAQRESTGLGSVYAEMVANILQPIVMNPKCKLIRYDVFHALPSTANTIIGRAAHIAVLDSEMFIEKFLMVCGLKYFK